MTAQYNFDFGSLPNSTTITGNDGLSGYRQTIIQAYPMAIGLTFSGINLQASYVTGGVNPVVSKNCNWLDIKIAGNTIRTFTARVSGVADITFPLLSQFEWVGSSRLSSCATLFGNTTKGCAALQSVKGTEWTSLVTDFSNMFQNCSSLVDVSTLNTFTGTSFSNMFDTCTSLENVPFLNTSKATIITSMFNTCYALRIIPSFDFSNVTTSSNVFYSCYSLKSVPPLNLGKSSTLSGLFSGCRSLADVGRINASSATSLSNMFYGCSSLKTIPFIDMNVTGGVLMTDTFSGCSKIETIPLINTSKVGSFSSAFNNCISLKTIPLINTSSVTTFTSMFDGCSSLQSIPLLNVAAGTLFSNMFRNCPSLKQGALSGPKVSLVGSSSNGGGYSGCSLSSAALNQIFANLAFVGASGAGSQTIWVGGNWGLSGCNKSIASDRGWNALGTN